MAVGAFTQATKSAGTTTMTPDALQAEVERRQQARLNRSTLITDLSSALDEAKPSQPSPWAHVPLRALFEANGNTMLGRGDGRIESGHEPHHASRSGACVLITPQTGFWWCRSCGKRGDAVAYVMQRDGTSFRKAAELLTAEYGAPKTGWKPRRRVWVVDL